MFAKKKQSDEYYTARIQAGKQGGREGAKQKEAGRQKKAGQAGRVRSGNSGMIRVRVDMREE